MSDPTRFQVPSRAMSAPSTSIVIPLYNKRATVARAIDSILSQTMEDFELIIVDDGSRDCGADLVEAQYQDPRLRVVRQANSGPGAARNRGFSESRGVFVTFLDADDVRDPGHLETALAVLDRHPECGAFTSNFTVGPDRVERWDELRRYGFAAGSWRLAPAASRDDLRHCVDAFHSVTAVYRREVFEAHGGFFTADRCNFGEDVYLWIRIALNHAFYRHDAPLGHYHTEDSELGIGGRQGLLPIEPVLTHADGLRADCPPEMAAALELWLGRQALRGAFMQLDRGDASQARRIVDSFPRARDWSVDYLRLHLKLMSPSIWRLARRVAGKTATSLS